MLRYDLLFFIIGQVRGFSPREFKNNGRSYYLTTIANLVNLFLF